MNNFKISDNNGVIVIFALIFGSIFLFLSAGLLDFILLQSKQSLRKAAWNNSLYIAEAGMNYYRWHINQEPKDIQDGEDWCCSEPPCKQDGFIVCGPYEHNYYNPQGQLVGKFVLEIKAKEICGEILGVYVKSTGWTNQYPELKRKVQAKFSSSSIAEYAYIINDAVWAGGDREIYGKYHSNQGIRMDGTHNSLVSSAVSDWLCSSSFGCSSWNCPDGCESEGSYCRCNGVAGAGSDKDLWKFPLPAFDFEGITADLNQMKILAQSQGKYYSPSEDINPLGKGYHIILRDDGLFDIKIITELQGIYVYSMNQGWHWSYERIIQEQDYQTGVSFNPGCGLIFAEDDIWAQGVLKGHITIASADLINPHKDTSCILNGNIDYTNLDGSDSLAIITEQDILIPLYSPNEMILRGVFVAQKGHFGREHYSCWWYWPECKRDNLMVYGSIVSNGRVGTKWSSSGLWASGYNERENYFDQKLASDPPPLLPYVSEELELISWEE